MNYGYARCSTNESKQDINRQVRELKAAGAEEIFIEYEHGDSKIKSQQSAMFNQAVAGDTIKAEMTERNTEELIAGQYIIRWTSVLSNRFDSTGFKRVCPELYKAYTKQVSSRRFTISA